MEQNNRDTERDILAPDMGKSSSDSLSEDTPPEVKRENPYLRKNREKPQKPPKSPKAPREPASSAVPATDGETAGNGNRTFSQFIFEHVKLLTAILTCLVILSLVIITDVTGWIEDYQFKQEQKDKTPLTLSRVRALTDRGQDIIWDDLANYARFDTDAQDDSVTWKFKVVNTGIEGAELELWISGVNTSHTPTYVRLYDMMSGESMDLNKQNLDLFLDKIEEMNQ